MNKDTITVIIQDSKSLTVLTTGTTTEALLKKTKLESRVFLIDSLLDNYTVDEILMNGDKTAALIKVKTKKENQTTDFQEENKDYYSYLRIIEKKIQKSVKGGNESSHIASVLKKGKPKIAQKFGEEVVELVIESGKNDDKKFIDEAADALYYYLILLHERGFSLTDVLKQLRLQKRKI
jgi:phosphoribosyl-ATP pyrophosphohydrolase/phosphoribosyl-AMP cyclohydrolase